MDNMKPKLITKQAVVIDLVLTVVFFVWITSILKKHVPWSEAGQTAVLLGAAYCGLCLAGVFWMALSLFRVTLADQMLPKTVDGKQSN
jgi:protein-S-isoprenylcysteine O-methyltransferase Ste14